MKENLKSYVYKQSKHVKVRWRTFCRTVRRVYAFSKANGLRSGAEVKTSLNRAKS